MAEMTGRMRGAGPEPLSLRGRGDSLKGGSGAASGIASLPLVLIQTGVLWAGVASTHGFTQPDQGLHANWNRRHPRTRYTA